MLEDTILIHSITKRTHLRLRILQSKFPNAHIEFNSRIMNYKFLICKAVIIPTNVKRLSLSSFYGLKKIIIPPNITQLYEKCFYHCRNLSIVIIEGKIKEIPVSCFYKCRKLEIIVFSNTIETIRQSAFEYCDSLKLLTFGDSVKYIHNYAFCCCKNLEKIILGSNVESIEDFYKCPKLKCVEIHTKKILSIENNLFDNIEEVKGRFDCRLSQKNFHKGYYNFSWNNFNKILIFDNFKIENIDGKYKYTIYYMLTNRFSYIVFSCYWPDLVNFEFKVDEIITVDNYIFSNVSEIEVSKYQGNLNTYYEKIYNIKFKSDMNFVFKDEIEDFYKLIGI